MTYDTAYHVALVLALIMANYLVASWIMKVQGFNVLVWAITVALCVAVGFWLW